MAKIVDLFRDRKSDYESARRNSELIYNLVCVATSDGLLHEKELKILIEEATLVGIPTDVAKELIRTSGSSKFVPPRSEAEAKRFLGKLVKIALADGELSVHEMEIINNKRIELNISKTYLETLIQTNTELLKQA